jgi:3-hydroxymyristoyl/3-hydroxydecanoyl-(acyl carrier protein) dehydratase
MVIEFDAAHGAGGFVIDADHPALPGHCPGRPVVPGMVLVDYAIAVLQVAVPAFVPCGIRTAKFFAPVLPGEQIDVRFRAASATGYIVTCSRGSETVMSCTLTGGTPAGGGAA